MVSDSCNTDSCENVTKGLGPDKVNPNKNVDLPISNDYSINTSLLNQIELQPGQQKWINTVDKDGNAGYISLGMNDEYEGAGFNLIDEYLKLFIFRSPIDISSLTIESINSFQMKKYISFNEESEQKPIKIPQNLLAVETLGFRIIKPLFEI